MHLFQAVHIHAQIMHAHKHGNVQSSPLRSCKDHICCDADACTYRQSLSRHKTQQHQLLTTQTITVGASAQHSRAQTQSRLGTAVANRATAAPSKHGSSSTTMAARLLILSSRSACMSSPITARPVTMTHIQLRLMASLRSKWPCNPRRATSCSQSRCFARFVPQL